MVTAYRQPPSQSWSKQDEEQLGLLSVFLYCYAAFSGLVAIGIGAFAIVPALLVAAAPSQAGDPSPFLVGGILFGVFGSIAVIFMAKAALMVLAGRAVGRRHRHTLVMVAACLALPNFPVGTALGVFAIMLLQRPSVRPLF